MKAKLLSGKAKFVPGPQESCTCGPAPTGSILGTCTPTGTDPSGIY